MGAPGPSLFDLVPWNYGFVHTGVLSWLLQQPGMCRRVLDASVPAILPGQDVQVSERPKTEDARMGAKCDLGFILDGGQGRQHKIAVETKVEDLLREEQLAGYDKAEYRIAFLPGLTGFLARESEPLANASTLTGKALTDSLRPGLDSLPPLVASYIDAVDAEADWFEEQVQRLRSGHRADGDPPKTSRPEFARDIAWVVALQREIKERAGCPVGTDHMHGRAEAYDHGFFWGDAYSASPEHGGVRYYIDAAAKKQQDARAVIIKAGFREDRPNDALAYLHSHALDAGPPKFGSWKGGQRRFTKDSVSCWAADCSDSTIAHAADLAVCAANWIVDQQFH